MDALQILLLPCGVRITARNRCLVYLIGAGHATGQLALAWLTASTCIAATVSCAADTLAFLPVIAAQCIMMLHTAATRWLGAGASVTIILLAVYAKGGYGLSICACACACTWTCACRSWRGIDGYGL